METCLSCYGIQIDYCDEFIIELPLEDGSYTVQIEDHQTGMIYEQTVEFTEDIGIWDTSTTSGVFTPFSIYTLTVLDSEDQPVSWTVGYSEYNCATVTFKQVTDANPES